MHIIMEKRGRKRKPDNVQMVVVEELQDDAVETAVAKKRGRKPKGGKIVSRQLEEPSASTAVANVILHLKCTRTELEEFNLTKHVLPDPLQYNPDVPPEIVSFDSHPDVFAPYESVREPLDDETVEVVAETPLALSTEQKVKRLKISLYKNQEAAQKSACFWCTYAFDNDTCYIPRSIEEGTVYAYGSFCRPECAAAHLMHENLDDSTKFERYHLLNQLYKGRDHIRPAPDPYYLLDRFYGTLTIQEYRRLLNSEHFLYTLDKPMTRILPELHEVTDEFILGVYGNKGHGGATQAGGVYKVKRQSEKPQGPSKASIIRGKFGMTQ